MSYTLGVPAPSILVEGAATDEWANAMNVPGFGNGYDRANESLWVDFSTGNGKTYGVPNYIESGQYVGTNTADTLSFWAYPPTADCCTLHYYLDGYFNGGAQYYEADFPTGPSPSSYTEYETLDPGRDGTWCQYIAGSQIYCWSGLPPYSNLLETGLELHVRSGVTPSVGTGLSGSWAQFLDSRWYNQWQSNAIPASAAVLVHTPTDNGLCVSAAGSYPPGNAFYSTALSPPAPPC